MNETNQPTVASGDADGSIDHSAAGLPADQDPAYHRQIRDLRSMTAAINSGVEMPTEGFKQDGLPDPVDEQLHEHEEKALAETSVVWVEEQWSHADEVTETRACVVKTNGTYQKAVMRSVGGGEPTLTLGGGKRETLEEAIRDTRATSQRYDDAASQAAAAALVAHCSPEHEKFIRQVDSGFHTVERILDASGALECIPLYQAMSVLRLAIARCTGDSTRASAAEASLQELEPALTGHDLRTFDGWVGAAKALLQNKPKGTVLVDSVNRGCLLLVGEILYGLPIEDAKGPVPCQSGVPLEAYEADRSLWDDETSAWEAHDPRTNRDVLLMPRLMELQLVDECQEPASAQQTGKERSMAAFKIAKDNAEKRGLQILPSVDGPYVWNPTLEKVVGRRGSEAYRLATSEAEEPPKTRQDDSKSS